MNADTESLAYRAEQYARHAYDLLDRRHATPNRDDREDVLRASAVLSRVAEALAMRDLADAQRELARSNDRLSLSHDAMTDAVRARNGVREQAA